MNIVVRLENVLKKYHNKTLLSDISFIIKQGEITTLIGPNGAGKTTIAKLMLGLEKPNAGKIFVKKNLKLSYVPQKLNFSTNFPITVQEFLALLVTNYQPNQLAEYKNFIDLTTLLTLDVNSLSLGQLSKLSIIATIMNKPDLIVLDEPTQSLDIVSQKAFYQLIESRKKNYGTTFFIISHDVFTVMKNSDQVICINGHICCSGRPEEKKYDDQFLETLSELSLYNHHHDHSHS